MKNSYKPAHPADRSADYTFQGLTKREYFVAVAMNAIVSKIGPDDNKGNPNYDYISDRAFGLADAILQKFEPST